MGRNPTLKEIMALFCSDIDIFLLKEKDQKTDKKKAYTAREIRKQLVESSNKLLDLLELYGIDIDEPV